MKSPDEIKMALASHMTCNRSCKGCAYNDMPEHTNRPCTDSMCSDALNYIHQLEIERPLWHILPYDLPPYTGSYIVCTASGKVCTAKWYEQRNDFAGIGRKHIVAWQWLPLGILVAEDNDEIC